MLILSYRLDSNRAVLNATFGDRAEMTQWLACMAQEGRIVRVVKVVWA